MDVPALKEKEGEAEEPVAELMSSARHRFRAAVRTVEFSNNYTRQYPDVAALDRAGRIAMLHDRCVFCPDFFCSSFLFLFVMFFSLFLLPMCCCLHSLTRHDTT